MMAFGPALPPFLLLRCCGHHLWRDVERPYLSISTARYREKLLREGDRDDGKVSDLTPAFRANLRVSVCVAIARGMAMQLLAAGLPGKCTRNAPALLPTPTKPNDSSSDDDDLPKVTDEEILQLIALADENEACDGSGVDADIEDINEDDN